MPAGNKVQFIAYPDRIGEDVAYLADFIETRLAQAIGGVHLLPPFPFNADGGFSPLTHREIDPRLGGWSDVERISARSDSNWNTPTTPALRWAGTTVRSSAGCSWIAISVRLR